MLLVILILIALIFLVTQIERKASGNKRSSAKTETLLKIIQINT